MMADLNKARSEALANDFENHNLKREISDLKKSNLSLSNISISSCKAATKDESTMTEPHQAHQAHHVSMITIPIAEKKKEVMFNLGDPTHRLGSSQTHIPTGQTQVSTMKQKLSKHSLTISGSA